MMIDRISLLLVIIGALNWGSVALFQLDLVAYLFGGSDAMISRVVYALVALALFISFSILNIADLSTDGCFTLGCAVCASVTAR